MAFFKHYPKYNVIKWMQPFPLIISITFIAVITHLKVERNYIQKELSNNDTNTNNNTIDNQDFTDKDKNLEDTNQTNYNTETKISNQNEKIELIGLGEATIDIEIQKKDEKLKEDTLNKLIIDSNDT